jgi:DNA-binding transcriptional LysR family regulator
MNLEKLQCFIEVARCGSFTDAAHRLYTSQSNVSKQIVQMEGELETQLFIRTRRSVALTPAGEYLYEQTKDIPAQLTAIFERTHEIGQKSENTIFLGILEAQDVNHDLRNRLSRLREVYPEVTFELERGSFRSLRTGLRSGHYDLIITKNFDVSEEPEFVSRPLLVQMPAIAINSNHPKAQQSTLTLKELKDENFVVISQEESPVGYRVFLDQCRKEGFEPKVVRTPHSLESVLLCVEMGIGIALLDQHTRLERTGSVRTIPFQGDAFTVSVVCQKNDTRPIIANMMRLLATG